jgi:hypothetical protein
LHEVTGLPLLDYHDADERGRLGLFHLLKQLGARPARPFPEITDCKDLAELATYADGYARFTQAWHAIGDGGEL